MIATVAVFLSSLLAAPQNPSLRLPASQQPQPNPSATVQRPVSEIDRFVRHVARLRTAPVEVERTLQTLEDTLAQATHTHDGHEGENYAIA